MRADLTRREVLAATAGVGALAAGGCSLHGTAIPGTLGGADPVRGHMLRDGRFPEPEGAVEDVSVVIAGGGALYDVATDVWVEVPALGHRDWPAIAVAGRRVVVVGGQDWSAATDGGPLGDAWIWTPG